MTDPVYVPAAPGLELLVVSFVIEADKRPVASDARIGHEPIAAWQIEPPVYAPPNARPAIATPVRVRKGSKYDLVLVALSENHFCDPTTGAIYNHADKVAERALRAAQDSWDRRHGRRLPRCVDPRERAE